MPESAIAALITALRGLPGVGQKSAQRMAYHLLQHDQAAAQQLAQALQTALAQLRHCERCHTFTESAVCDVCDDPARSTHQICVLENPADLAAFERVGSYHGQYFVLMGRLSPLDGVGAGHIGMAALMQRVQDERLQEVIIATSFTAEGEATAHALADLLSTARAGLRITRLARGVPVGSELEYVDLGTIAHAFADRR
jgi:recombination protein RecR